MGPKALISRLKRARIRDEQDINNSTKEVKMKLHDDLSPTRLFSNRCRLNTPIDSADWRISKIKYAEREISGENHLLFIRLEFTAKDQDQKPRVCELTLYFSEENTMKTSEFFDKGNDVTE
jgi:hypothetical protein